MKVSEFRIVSNGIHPLLLGMDREQLDRAMGEESTSDSAHLPNEVAIRYPAANARVVMRDGRAVEVSLVPPAKVLFEAKSLFDGSSVWRELVGTDGDARLVLGFIVLPRLGLTLTGFHDRDIGQLAVTSFERGRWSSLEGQMKPFEL